MACSRLNWAFALTTSLVAMYSGSAFAEETPGKDASVSSGEIIVTAQRREERLRDVPLSISAFSGKQLQEAGINDTQALTSAVPGLKMDAVGGFTVPSVRGITTQVTSAGSDTNVAIYVDGVYLPAPNAGMFELPDIQRIEVLKGPQGTLFGRNATGGAIQIVTREPTYEVAGNLTAGYGNMNDFTAKGFVSVPVVDNRAALSVAGYYEHNDGYLRSLQTGDYVSPFRSRLLRGKLRLDPTDDLKIILFAEWSARDDARTAFAVPLNGNTSGRTIPGSIIPPGDPYVVAQNPIMPIISTNEHYGYGATATLQTGIGVLKSITSFGEYKAHGVNDADDSVQPAGVYGLLYDAYTTDRAFSQELSFASKLNGPLNFVVGGYYIKGWGGWTPLNVLDTFSVSIVSRRLPRGGAVRRGVLRCHRSAAFDRRAALQP